MPPICPNRTLFCTLPGRAKLTWLIALEASARNCSETRSPIFVFLTAAMSVSRYPGPYSAFFPVFPKVPSLLRFQLGISCDVELSGIASQRREAGLRANVFRLLNSPRLSHEKHEAVSGSRWDQKRLAHSVSAWNGKCSAKQPAIYAHDDCWR